MLQAVLDIGKTHIKLLVIENGQPAASFSSKNAPLMGMYPQADVDGIWRWLTETLKSYSRTAEISAIVVTTHGATAALIDNSVGDRDQALALAVLDYEYDGIAQCESDYAAVRPDFNETLSPQLPAGLNLGRQLFWLQAKYPKAFSRVTHILMYPQYWAWRLGAELASEVTSLGCHTDLWQPAVKDYSTLVERCGWRDLFPPLKNAWDELGTVSQAVSQQTSLPADCKIYTGIHDSNASLLRYLLQRCAADESFTVISTGTWTIAMQANGDVSQLGAHRDTLANVDIFKQPVSCARFMGGREYETICARLGGNISMAAQPADIQQAINERWLVTPDFSNGNGPFGGAEPVLACPAQPPAPQAIATLYCALMIDQRLNDLNATGPIYIEGAFLKNTLLCELVAQLRPEQTVMLSQDNTGTVMGAAALIGFDSNTAMALELQPCRASAFTGLDEYRQNWYQRINQ
ncbi:FGGY-family carbohydrate kinase [Alteromonas gilva]|uniref:FGGY family carbohydrate kinase n=1 Tax=Alteromonas gilva TaxID=2987522 RepID=A0ABT5L813_9ALTE|nr:FGGY family carbohydrate kinase [Alteromonas gilva]MDC8831938.1 FGGY family carbohydrate kinase [Alteromonas gilva]